MRGGDAPALVLAQDENRLRLDLAHFNGREVYLLLLVQGRQSAAVRLEHQAQAAPIEPGVLGVKARQMILGVHAGIRPFLHDHCSGVCLLPVP
jgi:hypothetical protein